jgi:hypothetical protein
MLKLNYNSKVATSRNVGKKRLGERLQKLKGLTFVFKAELKYNTQTKKLFEPPVSTIGGLNWRESKTKSA